MKLLMFHAEQFGYRAHARTFDDAPDPDVAEHTAGAAVVVFVHAEEGDAEREAKLVSKAARNVKWLANKRSLRNVVLHSFTHLAATKAPAGFASAFLEALARRLESNGYTVTVTPFGWSCAWNMDVHGDPIAKVFKSI